MKSLVGCLIVATAYTACDKPRSPAPAPAPAPAAVPKSGIEVALITREPRIAAPAGLDGPVTAGWPDEGRAVQWIGAVINRTGAAQTVPIVWRIGSEVTRRTVTLPPGRSELSHAWLWSFSRTKVSLTIEPAEAIDADRTDNEVTVDSDALTIGMFVGRPLYEWMAQDGRPGFEVWFQGQLREWHKILARARFPSAPNGAIDRFRLDRVDLLEEGQSVQNADVGRTDIFMVLPYGDTRFLQVGSLPSEIADQTIVFHELLHGRGLTDLYAYAVRHAPGTDATIDILDGGRPVVGTFLMPSLGTSSNGAQLVYPTPVNGVMGSQYRFSGELTEVCVNGLNLWAKRRTPWSVDQFGNAINHLTQQSDDAYVWRVPESTRLTFVDDTGAAVSPATVEVYVDHHLQTYQEHYRSAPDVTLRPGSDGTIRLAGEVLLRSAARLGRHAKSEVVILGVRTAEARGYAFVPVHYFNLLYFQERDHLEVPVKMHR